jgi:hypothetical protein
MIESDLGSAGVSPAMVVHLVERKSAGETPALQNSEESRDIYQAVSHKEKESMPDELSELQENAEHGRENPSLAPISVTMAILAVCVAVVSLLGHRSHTEELLMQNRATDQWAYYQAKNIRLHNYDMGLDMLPLIDFKDKEQAGKVQEKYKAQVNRYTKEQAEIEEQAKDFEGESARAQRKADRFDMGEVFLEIALVITSLALLSRKQIFWFLGMISGVAGLAVAMTGYLMR